MEKKSYFDWMKSDTKGLSLKKQLEKLNNFINDACFLSGKRERYIRDSNCDFTRCRKLDFPTTVVFILGLLKKV